MPVFFVLMGMRVELGAFLQPGVLGLAALLTIVAVAGKQVCALGGIGAPVDRTAIGIGMIPRGEVGLIFANIGLGLTVRGERVVDERIFAADVPSPEPGGASQCTQRSRPRRTLSALTAAFNRSSWPSNRIPLGWSYFAVRS